MKFANRTNERKRRAYSHQATSKEEALASAKNKPHELV